MYKSKLDLVKEAAIEQALSSGYKPRQLFMEYLEKNPLSKGEKDTLIKQLDDSELTIQDLIGMYYILEVDNEIESETNQRLEIERLCTEIKLFNTTLANSFIKPLVERFSTVSVNVKDPSDKSILDIELKCNTVYAVILMDDAGTMMTAIGIRTPLFVNIMTGYIIPRDICMTFELGSYDKNNADSVKKILSPFYSCEIIQGTDLHREGGIPDGISYLFMANIDERIDLESVIMDKTVSDELKEIYKEYEGLDIDLIKVCKKEKVHILVKLTPYLQNPVIVVINHLVV